MSDGQAAFVYKDADFRIKTPLLQTGWSRIKNEKSLLPLLRFCAYAALLTDIYSAQRAILSNNSNIACMGAFTLGEKLAEELLKTWLGLHFDLTSTSAPKVARFQEYDRHREELEAR